MNEELENIYWRLYKNDIPDNWRRVSFETCQSLSQWQEGLVSKCDFLQQSGYICGVLFFFSLNFLLFKIFYPLTPITVKNYLNNITDIKIVAFQLEIFFYPYSLINAIKKNYAINNNLNFYDIDLSIVFKNFYDKESIHNKNDNITIFFLIIQKYFFIVFTFTAFSAKVLNIINQRKPSTKLV